MKIGIYKDLFPVFMLLLTFSCMSKQSAEIPQSVVNPRRLWVYGKPTTFFMDDDEKEAASFISFDQLEQLNEVGPVIQSKLDDKKYFIENRPNNLYLTSYLLQCSDSYFLFNYAMDFAGGTVVWAIDSCIINVLYYGLEVRNETHRKPKETRSSPRPGHCPLAARTEAC